MGPSSLQHNARNVLILPNIFEMSSWAMGGPPPLEDWPGLYTRNELLIIR